MPKKLNTFTQFLPIQGAGGQNLIIKNECYFSMIFLGGNYLSSGSLLQKIFGGRDEVALIAGLRLQPDGLLINSVEEPNVIIDKRSIKPGKNVNIPMVLNLMTKIPAYMDTIGFSFKIATVKRSDNFSVALDVLNDSGNKGVLEAFMPSVVGKALGVGKVVKDMFDKLDAASNRDLIQLVVNDFIIPATNTNGANNLQEGFLVVFVKNEEEEVQGDTNKEKFQPRQFIMEDGFDNEKEVAPSETVFIKVNELEKKSRGNANAEAAGLTYDEVNKVLKLNEKIVTNTYLVFKIQRDKQRGENLNAVWSKKFMAAVETLANEFVKTLDKLKELQPRVTQLLSEATALLAEDAGFTPVEKAMFRDKYRSLVAAESAQFK